MREVYAERLSILVEEARSKPAGWLEISSVEAGSQTVGWLCGRIDAESAAAAAAKRNGDGTPVGRFSQGGIDPARQWSLFSCCNCNTTML
jgi:DNA-binding transcriptional MocR family regulator